MKNLLSVSSLHHQIIMFYVHLFCTYVYTCTHTHVYICTFIGEPRPNNPSRLPPSAGLLAASGFRPVTTSLTPEDHLLMKFTYLHIKKERKPDDYVYVYIRTHGIFVYISNCEEQ